MCGRKYDSEEAAREREVYLGGRNYDAWWRRMEKERQKRLKFLLKEHRSFDIRPTNTHAVVLNRDGEPDAEAMTWGFQPGWAKRILINSRGDKLAGRAWGKAFRERRCFIPVGGFYEWTGAKGNRQPHAFMLADADVMLLAGLWFEHQGELCYTVITTDAGDWMNQYHNREPVIIRPQDAEEWLLSEGTPFDLVGETGDGELEEFACVSPSKEQPPRP